MFKLRRPAPATVIAMAALFVALGGTGYAVAKLPRNSVGTPQLKKNAVIGSKVRNNAIGGADVNEATLGQVPSAANADALDGLDSTAFQRAATQETQHYVIGGASLVDGDSADRASFFNSNRWCGKFGSASAIDFFGAIHLPQGATMTGLAVDYVDDGGTTGQNGAVFLTATPRGGAAASSPSLATAPMNNTVPAGEGRTVSVAVTGGVGRVVDNTAYVYEIQGGVVEADVAICAVDVRYTLPSG